MQRIPATQDYVPNEATPTPAAPSPPPAPTADSFVHLHVHSNFSFLDGGSRIEDLAARAASLGQTALALTDHDGLYGAVRFAKACAKHGLKPIFGVEVRVESLLAGATARRRGARPARPRRRAAGRGARPPARRRQTTTLTTWCCSPRPARATPTCAG